MHKGTSHPIDSVLFISGMALFIIAISGEKFPWLTNVWIRGLGKISFSCYLVHFGVLSLVLSWFQIKRSIFGVNTANGLSSPQTFVLYGEILLLALAGTVALAALTYPFLEKPCIALGKCLIDRLSQRAPVQPEGLAVTAEPHT